MPTDANNGVQGCHAASTGCGDALEGQGKHRESANEYWKAYPAIPSPTHESRYQIFRGYTTTIRGDWFAANDNDVRNMEAVLGDEHEPKLFRMEAGYTLCIIHYSRSERHRYARRYTLAVDIGERKPKKAKHERKERMEMIILMPAGVQEKKTMKDITQGLLSRPPQKSRRLEQFNQGN